jgi:predicted O-methyltransferase YrrM
MKPEDVLKSIEETAPKKGLPIIGPERGLYLDEVVRQYRPKTILEVGTLVGYSAIRMGRLVDKSAKITCVEVDEDIAKVARINIKNAGLADKIKVVVGDAKKVLPTLKGEVDLLFLDAAKEEYMTYLSLSEKHLHKGSVVVADNVKKFANEMAEYLDHVRNSGKYRSAYKEAPPNYPSAESDAIEVSVRL